MKYYRNIHSGEVLSEEIWIIEFPDFLDDSYDDECEVEEGSYFRSMIGNDFVFDHEE